MRKIFQRNINKHTSCSSDHCHACSLVKRQETKRCFWHQVLLNSESFYYSDIPLADENIIQELVSSKLLSWRPRQCHPQRYLNQHLEVYKSHWFEAELSFRMKSWSQPNANEHRTNSSSACWGDTTAQVVRWSLKGIDCKTSSRFWSWLMHRYLTFMVSRIIL